MIGTGRMGRLHARVHGQVPQVRLVGVYDANAESAAEAGEKFGARAFATVDELLAQGSAVTIATPAVTHLEIARACLSRRIPA